MFTPRPTSSAWAARSTRLVFLIVGVGSGAWAPLVPFAKARLGASDAGLGLLLLCLGAGSIAAMPLAGVLATRLGVRRVVVAAALLLCLCLPLMASLASLVPMVAALMGFGAAVGTLDVSVNLQAIVVERESGTPMMSGFHGFYSAGGIVGAVGATALLGWGASALGAALVVVAGLLAVLAVAAPHLFARRESPGGPLLAFPRGIVWLLGALCFTVFLAEGSVLDWSAVFLSSYRGVAKAYAGLGYAAFAATMTVGRLLGDRLVRRLGGPNILALGGVCAATGFLIVTLVDSWPMSLLGYALVGAGCSNIVPVVFTSVGRQRVLPEALAIPAITTLGYAGLLAGPAAIGFVARGIGLPAAFLGLALLLLGVAASSRLLPSAGRSDLAR